MNNILRHEHRVLSEKEKLQVKMLKDKGLELYEIVDNISNNRELSIALVKIEEAIMWAMKGIIQ